MSRYRRRATSVTGDVDNHMARTTNPDLNNTPPVPAIPRLLKTASPHALTGGQTDHVLQSSVQHQLRHTDTQWRTMDQTIDDSGRSFDIPPDSIRGRTLSSDRNMQHGSLEPRDVSWEAERDRLLEEQKRKDLERLEEELENSRKAKTQLHKLRSPVVEKFVLLAKGSKSNKDGVSPASPTNTPTRSSTRRSAQEHVKTLPAHIEPGGKGIVPQKDAPTSAINAGDRNVTVRYRHHTFSLPVTPETTAMDIIAQTSSKMTYDHEASPESCIAVEQYSVLGLERRLRRYERIRDVMNSWDRDAQNQLAIVLTDGNDNHDDLAVGAVAKGDDAPPRMSVLHAPLESSWEVEQEMGHAPRKWPDYKDAVSLCHLSDYDLYTPTESQMRRHIKPPKRFCFAIKSQHKTTFFLNTDNYVQYFSTEDPQVAREFKQKAHGWRSWYLVGRNPDIRKKEGSSGAGTYERSAEPPPTEFAPIKSDNVVSVDGHRLRVSIDESPYSIGRFEPLLDMKRFDKRLSQFGRDSLPPESDPPSKHIADHGIRRRLSKREKPDTNPPNTLKRESEEGFTGGLLGEEYDNRKQVLANLEMDKKKRPQDLAFTEGPSLLNSQQDPESSTDKPESSSWFPSALEHTAKQLTGHQTTSVGGANDRHFSLNSATQRPAGLFSSAPRPPTQHSSRHPHSHTYTQPHPNPLGSQPTELAHLDGRVPPKPLVDLTPTIYEPPQWSKEKTGHGVKPPEGVGHLINLISVGNGSGNTTSGHPEPPPRTVMRRPTTSGSASLGRTRSMSAATSSGRPLLDDVPPVPVLPPRHGLESSDNSRRLAGAPVSCDDRIDRQETVRHKEKEREREQRGRDYREREAAYNAVPGRRGTLKVV
ncbi:hypothetical protein NUW58_g1528 [Xylaria curta]|uniref:Uncharacterized protein n=1 Tax=Xylaria curta TaxID=42375 RepID=A0ACC1PKB8_9PEZI|nr:hypothetical protein NUW58_g1528 [Xylaria curta]